MRVSSRKKKHYGGVSDISTNKQGDACFPQVTAGTETNKTAPGTAGDQRAGDEDCPSKNPELVGEHKVRLTNPKDVLMGYARPFDPKQNMSVKDHQ